MFIGIGINMVGQMTATSLRALLFSANEPGFTFEPWDITTLYQDRAGTTPVTAAGQSVGLRLDKSQGLRLGSELVTNGDFATDTWWLKGGGCTISGGVGVATAAANGSGFYRTAFSTIGSYYEITFTVVSVSAGGFRVGFFASAYSATRTAPGTYTVRLRADGTAFVVETVGTTTGTVDNVSVKEITGNHEVAVSDAKRGVYGWMPKTGRRNLLTYTEQFDNAVWTKNNATVGANDTAPSGAVTQKIVENTANATHGASFAWNFGAVANAVTISFYAKAAGRSSIHLSFINTDQFASFNLSTGVATRGGYFASASMSDLGNGWYRCVTTTIPFDGSRTFNVFVNSLAAYTGDGSSGVQFGGAQLETGSTATAYQRVVSQYDITEAGIPTCYYVQADGVDDACVTPTITPNTDKVQVFAGVRKLSDATGIIIEPSTLSGSFYLVSGSDTGVIGLANGYTSNAHGSAATSAQQNSQIVVNGPDSAVITATHDIAGDLSTIRRNGIAGASGTGDKGTGNFLAYPTYIYARAGTSLPFNGLDFGHAVRFGSNLDAATIARVESLIARNTPGVTL